MKGKAKRVDVHVRIRPLVGDEVDRGDEELLFETPAPSTLVVEAPKTDADDVDYVEVLGFTVPKSKPKRRKTYRYFASIQRDKTNGEFFEAAVGPLVATALDGRTACVFAYGHTGSGKTHTILGYGNERGMYDLATVQLFGALDELNERNSEPRDVLQVQVRFNEIYNGEVYDLLNDSAKCFVREDAHGKIQIRGELVTDDETGLVKPSSSATRVATTAGELWDVVQVGMRARSTGNSNVHRASSRSHALLELEIVTDRILRLREDVIEVEAALTRVGHERDTLEMDIFVRQHDKVEGKWVKKADARGASQDECSLLLDLRKELVQLDKAIEAAHGAVAAAQAAGAPCLGGTLVFVDLAGSEHAGSASDGIVKNETEQQECREINKSLSALKACFRSQAKNLSSTSCYRNSKLTLLLRDHFRTAQSKTMMVGTISPSSVHAVQTTHTLQYAQLVGEP
ncbi:hypothetical protein SDRG_11753 [Saprolegnia diclina VS20]|uniref:Kinesin-like protein n=1 Tax=Saprolegnia diclina (strain VS20) TaxID=1156394 RepID=T0QAZ1_SAPDV|nr:hypothetical protein SDRG_11753 [Saprolegnia diclina VS20]EQC30700.1 hypothetical protein SDRG_11753 [Saprolegnia diclina VS20]|eukprot:XP_008616026.1 hypothetical protein SDRG_11753 [Saprolegnia diclina VS20]